MSKVLDRNEAWVPFFGDKMTFVRGLDPLGLQNSSAHAYSYLLPGLNNVTSHIRSYSFYCWLLTEYARQIQSADPQELKKFIRKAEYIIALVAVKMGIEGISGITYATERFNENLPFFNLNEGTYNAEGTTEKTYWQSPFGIFGQYYLGSLRQIGLIEGTINEFGQAMGLYRRTSEKDHPNISGETLANAFDENISPANKYLFFSCIAQGSIDHDQLLQLAHEFDLNHIMPNSREAHLLLELLMDQDQPVLEREEAESMRRQTLLHVLRYAESQEEGIGSRDFTMHAYDVKGIINQTSNNCLTGWYYYQFNEYWQVACTSILNGLLDYLETLQGTGWMPLHELIQEATRAIIAFLMENQILASSRTAIISVSTTNFGSEQELYEHIMNNSKTPRMGYGFMLLWKLYAVNQNNLVRLRDYTRARSIGGDSDVLAFYLSYDKYLPQTAQSFIESFVLNKIIHRHQLVAYQKMGNGSQSTQKFIIEENCIRRIDNFEPGFTGPRVGNLIYFLRDLHLLDSSYRLTDAGLSLLIEHS